MTETLSTPESDSYFKVDSESVDKAVDEIIKRCAIFYCLFQPGKSPSDFLEEIFLPLINAEPGIPVHFPVAASNMLTEQARKGFTRLVVRCLDHCRQAKDEDTPSTQASAWRHVANAAFNLGNLEGLYLVEPSMEFLQASRGSVAAKTRNEKYDPLRKLARDLAKEGSFRSKRDAALKIKEKILAASVKIKGINLSESQAERTISGWLEGMTFGTKREP